MLQNAMQIGLLAVQTSNNNEKSCFHMILLRHGAPSPLYFSCFSRIFRDFWKEIAVAGP